MTNNPTTKDAIIMVSKYTFICTSIPKIERIVKMHPIINPATKMRIIQYIRANPALPSIITTLLIVNGLSVRIIESFNL